MMDTLLMMTVRDLVILVAVIAGWGGYCAWQAGHWWAARNHRDELATLRLEQRLRDSRFVDHADLYGLTDEETRR